MVKSSPRKARDTRRKTAPKAAAKTVRDTDRKTASVAEKPRTTHSPNVAAEKARDTHSKIVPRVAAEQPGDKHRKTDAQFEESRATQVPDSMHALAKRSVAQTREIYERSKNTLLAVVESWERSFGAAGEGAVALNHKIIDIAERNINTGFACDEPG